MKTPALFAALLGLGSAALPALADSGTPANPLGEREVRVAVIRNLGADDNTTQFLAGARAEGASLGFQVDTFLSNGDDARFQDFVDQAISQGYDGVILSQGRAPYSTGQIKRLRERDIAVAAFDTAVDEPIPGVTVTYQDDASLTAASFGQLIEDFDGKARIVKLWVAGFPPMERRQRAYQALREAHPEIEELESVGAVSSDVQGDTANRVNALLAKYPPGTIDAIWGTWDAFSQGAYRALKENGRDDIALYGIDISNQDLALMSEPDSPWRVSAAVDPGLIGRINLRLVALKLAGEPTPAEYEFPAASINQRQLAGLAGPLSVTALGALIPGWGESDDFRPDWYRALQQAHAQ